MYEDKSNEKDGTYVSEKDRVLAWTKDVAASTADEAPKSTSQAPHPEARHGERESPRVVVNQIIATPAVVVTRVRPEQKDEISTKAVIGTILGATAGAVVAYGTYFRNSYFLFQTRFQSLETCPGSLTFAHGTCFMLQTPPRIGNTDCGVVI